MTDLVNTRGAGRDLPAARYLAKWLSLAATPTFALMAVATALLGDSADTLCAAGRGIGLGGMVTMYLLMSAFHASAWLRWVVERTRAGWPS